MKERKFIVRRDEHVFLLLLTAAVDCVRQQLFIQRQSFV